MYEDYPDGEHCFGYIELVNPKTGMRKGIPEYLIDTINQTSACDDRR